MDRRPVSCSGLSTQQRLGWTDTYLVALPERSPTLADGGGGLVLWAPSLSPGMGWIPET